MARSTNGESADPKLRPSSDCPTPVGWEGLQRSVARGWTWPSAKNLLAAADKKVEGAPSCELQTLIAELEDIQIGQKKAC